MTMAPLQLQYNNSVLKQRREKQVLYGRLQRLPSTGRRHRDSATKTLAERIASAMSSLFLIRNVAKVRSSRYRQLLEPRQGFALGAVEAFGLLKCFLPLAVPSLSGNEPSDAARRSLPFSTSWVLVVDWGLNTASDGELTQCAAMYSRNSSSMFLRFQEASNRIWDHRHIAHAKHA